MNKRVYAYVDLIDNEAVVKSIMVKIIENYKVCDMNYINYDIKYELDEIDEQDIHFNKCKVKVEDISTCYTEMNFSQTFSTCREDIVEKLEEFAYRLAEYTDRIERFIEYEADNYGLTIEY